MPKATCVVPAEFQTWRRSPPAWFTKRTCTVVAEPFQVDSNEKVSSVSVVVRANTSPTSGRPEIPPVADMSLGAGAALSIVTLPFSRRDVRRDIRRRDREGLDTVSEGARRSGSALR